MTTAATRRSLPSARPRPALSRSPQTPASPRSRAAKFPSSGFLRLSEPLGDLLVPPDKGALLFQCLLQLFDRNVAWIRIAAKRQRRGGAGGLPHRKAGAGDPRRRLAVMGHR